MKYYKFYQNMRNIWLKWRRLAIQNQFKSDEFIADVEGVMREYFEDDEGID